MKRLSVKWKLTVLYTAAMLLMTGVVLSVLLSLSTRELLSSVQGNLKKQVQESLEDIETEDGELEVDSDFYTLENNVYLSLYRSDGFFLYGKVPYGFDVQPEISDGELRRITGAQEEWYVLDLTWELEGYGPLTVRGVTSVTRAEESLHVTVRLALILFPLLLLLTAVLCYRLAKRALLPVRRITAAVEDIQRAGDLSRRIHLHGEQKKPGERNSGGDEIYHLAETFDEMLSRLEEAFRREQQFTSDAAHELRTPVSVLLAQCEDCLADGELSAAQREKLLVVQRKAKELSVMLSQLLLLARADQGRLPLTAERLNVSELTQMIVEEQMLLTQNGGRQTEKRKEAAQGGGRQTGEAQERAAGKELSYEMEIEPELYAMVDETLYIRMLGNLLSNAASYGRDGGHIRVTLKREGTELIGSVADDGIGMEQEVLAHIWERFYRGDGAHTDNGHAGLGLPMVQWIVRAHKGWITAESVPGRGSVFRFGFPIDGPGENLEEAQG